MNYLCIHGHFYQPPRENPSLEYVELQDSAYPYHDWNERVTAECYAPNAASRIMDEQGRIASIVNNYSKISFDFGPTLLSWLQDKAPEVYQSILEADRASRVSKIGLRAWKDVSGERIDPTRPYLLKLPSRRTLAVFFYDGPISKAVAFEHLLDDGKYFAERLVSGFSDTRDWTQLVHIATD